MLSQAKVGAIVFFVSVLEPDNANAAPVVIDEEVIVEVVDERGHPVRGQAKAAGFHQTGC